MNLVDQLVAPFADNEFLRHALLAGILVSLSCAAVGTFVVLRGLAFVGDALAHGVLPGVAGALLLGLPAVFGAVLGTVLMMGGVALLTRRSRLSSDTAIGLLFVGMLALGVMITSRSGSFSGDLTRILFGEVLGVSTAELWWQAVAVVVVAAVATVAHRPFMLLCIDPDLCQTSGFRVRAYELAMLALVALTVIASFQTVGTLLVFGMLLAPAATGALLARRIGTMMAVAAATGALASYVGLLVSYHFDLAAGASMVFSAVVLFGLAYLWTELRRARSQRRTVVA